MQQVKVLGFVAEYLSLNWFILISLSDLHMWCVLCPKLEGPTAATAGQHDFRVPSTANRMAHQNLASRLFLQECQRRHIPDDDDTEPLHLVVERQDHPIHGQVSTVMSHNYLDTAPAFAMDFWHLVFFLGGLGFEISLFKNALLKKRCLVVV